MQAGKVQWTVTNAYRTNQLQGNFGQQPKQGNFVVVDFTFKNNDDKPVTLATNSLSLIDSQGAHLMPHQMFLSTSREINKYSWSR